MKLSSWLMAAGAIACLMAAYLAAAPFARDQMLQFARAWQERSDGVELANRLVSPDSMLDYIAEHPDQISLASWEVGAGSQGIYYNAQRAQPVASGGSLLLLAACADELSDGRGQEVVPLASWERYWLPGIDGGAHQAALHEARTYGALLDVDDESTKSRAPDAGGDSQTQRSIRLNDVVRAMVRYGDPAAADLLMDRMGRSRLMERARKLGFSPDAAPVPFAGTQLSLLVGAPAPELLARYQVMPRRAYRDVTWDWLERLRVDDALRTQTLQRLERDGVGRSLREAAELTAALAPRATAGGYARLMQRIVSGQDASAQYMRAQLQWPLHGVATRADFDSFGSLSASEPGVLASVSYGRGKAASGTRVLALLLRRLPIGVWLHLSSSLVLRRFEAELLADDAFFARVRARLSGAALRAKGSESAANLHVGSAR